MIQSDAQAPFTPYAFDGVLSHFIDGKCVPDRGSRRAPIYEPALGVQVAEVALADPAQTRVAVEAAERALPAWSAKTPLARARVLFRFKALIEENLDRLATTITREHGKTLSDARGEVIRGLEVVEFACGIPQLLKGEHSISVGSSVDSWTLNQPVGVCVGITPFNFPAMVPMWMFPVAIACGNTFVLKPSEKDPTTSMILAELLAEAGLPDGVFNVVHGDREAVDTLIADPRVGAISFVGSTPIAESTYVQGAVNGKRVQALGGAKNHMVIMPDADLDQAVEALVGSAYGSAGERCMAISVAVPVGEETADRLAARLAERVSGLRVGDGLEQDPEPEMGPLVTPEHRDRVRSFVDAGVAEGASLLVDGRTLSVPHRPDGFFLGGCLFDHVREDMSIYQEEIFGPVLSIVRAPDFDEALRLIDDNPYGNGAAIFTGSGRAAREFSVRVQAGMVGVNVPIPVPMAFHSFGGWKRSRFGPLHIHGPDGVRFYTQLKTVTGRWPEGNEQANQFVMPTMR